MCSLIQFSFKESVFFIDELGSSWECAAASAIKALFPCVRCTFYSMKQGQAAGLHYQYYLPLFQMEMMESHHDVCLKKIWKIQGLGKVGKKKEKCVVYCIVWSGKVPKGVLRQKREHNRFNYSFFCRFLCLVDDISFCCLLVKDMSCKKVCLMANKKMKMMEAISCQTTTARVTIFPTNSRDSSQNI